MNGHYPVYTYLGLDELNDNQHIMVDGARRAKTSLVLSHWPASSTPTELNRDLSAEIAFAYLLDESAWDRSVTVVTNDHLDVDGLVGLYFLTHPKIAIEHADLLIDVARVGDFGVVGSARAAEIAWVLEALMADPDLALADLVDSEVTREGATTRTYRALLQVLERIITDTDQYSAFCRIAKGRFETTMQHLESGKITLEERPESDLCVVHLDSDLRPMNFARIGYDVPLSVDPCAIQSATNAPRILICRDRRFVYYDRYETWVRFQSRNLQLRRDLTVLARELSEIDQVFWTADPPSSLVAVMHHGEASSTIAKDIVIEHLITFLAREPVAWNPYASDGPLLQVS